MDAPADPPAASDGPAQVCEPHEPDGFLTAAELALCWLEGDGARLASVQSSCPPRIGGSSVWCEVYLDLDFAQAYLLRVTHGAGERQHLLAVLEVATDALLVTQWWPEVLQWWPETDHRALTRARHWFVDWLSEHT